MKLNKPVNLLIPASLGLVLLVLILSLPIDAGSSGSLYGVRFFFAPLGLFFLNLPFGSLWRKINAIFSSKQPAGNNDGKTVTAARVKSLADAQDLEEAQQNFLLSVREIAHPKFCDLYLVDPQGPGFRRENARKAKRRLPAFVPADSKLARQIANNTHIRFYKDGDPELQLLDPADTPPEHLDQEMHLIAPISSPNSLLGWLSLGPLKEDLSTTQLIISQIEFLVQLFSAVYQKFELLQAFQSKITEDEVRNRIEASVKSGKDLNQTLVEIYERLKPYLPINHFSLILQNPDQDRYERVFAIRDDECEVTTSKPEPLKAGFFENKAVANGQIQAIEENGSWLILPLALEEASLGALSLGNPNLPGLTKTVDLGFLHFLSSAVTNAIRFQRMEALNQGQQHQLEVINQVSQQLISITNIDSLLTKILDAAMSIIQSSSGILMVADEDQDELVFEVTAGPVGANVQGERLPMDAGIAGQAYTSQAPVIKNQINRDSLWFKHEHPKAVSKIENILAVPLIAHGHVIGVLEMINKHNHRPFDESDQKILEGFASQAAVALDNASIYSQTDQALEARVEELYTIQQIDRDLNTSRDIDHVLQRMLEAALAHTSARFGTIGLFDHDTETYQNIWQIQAGGIAPIKLEDIELFNEKLFSEENLQDQTVQNLDLSTRLNLPPTTQWHLMSFTDMEDDQALLLLLHTESPQQVKRQDKTFLSRLRDHGIIAVKNALLYEELHAAIQDKNEFISFISHELKNPLTVIKGYADILRKGMAGDVNEEQIDYLSTINHNVQRMNTFIKDLSDQAYIETQSVRLEFESTPVHEVVNDVLHSYAAQIQKKSLQVALKIPGEVPNVWCDRLRLIQILSNLISNAIKYTPEKGEIKIGAEHSANRWDEKGAAEVVHFWVEDNGYGIKPEDQAHLFEKFYRGTDARIKKVPGTGLGLRISKSLVEMMGGQMWFESTLDEGSTFHFTLPI